MNPYIIRQPVITERTLQRASQENVYTFEVQRTADKHTVKAAIEVMYGVTVVSVNIVMRPKKVRRTGSKRLTTLSAKTKKALVKLAEGQTIELFDTGGQS